MIEFIEKINEQIDEALNIANNVKVKSFDLDNILICGMGGSGIAGSIVSDLFSDESSLQISVNKDYNLPNWVSDSTLCIISSYSGYTEEIISCLNQAIQKGTNIICITTGGEIEAIAKQNNITTILIPNGYQPRAAIIYSLIQIISLLAKQGIIDKSHVSNILGAKSLITKESSNIQKDAKRLSMLIKSKTPIIYCEPQFTGLSYRFKQQLNENSKLFAFVSTIPEINHNELVALGSNNNDEFIHLFIQSEFNSIQMNKRFDFTKDLILKNNLLAENIEILGDNKMEKMIYFIHLTDYISYYISQKRGCDPFDIKSIIDLKDKLSSK